MRIESQDSLTTDSMSIHILHEGKMKVDGGVAYGIIPKSVWNKESPADRQNRITIGINQLLVKGPDFNLLVDTGIGTKVSDRLRRIYCLDELQPWETRLEPFGLKPNDVTHVVLTHLHFDHAGGSTVIQGESLSPAFPNAEYYLQKGEWQTACKPDERTRGSYCLRDFLPLETSKRIVLISGDRQIAGKIFVTVTGGHTPYHQLIRINLENGRKLLFPADICPTRRHLSVNRQTAYDICPLDTLSARKSLLLQTLGTDNLVVFSHDPEPGFNLIRGDCENPVAMDAYAAA